MNEIGRSVKGCWVTIVYCTLVDVGDPGQCTVYEVGCHTQKAIQVAETCWSLAEDLFDTCEHKVPTELLVVSDLAQLRQLGAHSEVD